MFMVTEIGNVPRPCLRSRRRFCRDALFYKTQQIVDNHHEGTDSCYRSSSPKWRCSDEMSRDSNPLSAGAYNAFAPRLYSGKEIRT
jgi:hypothetical protein